jgi:hypothetical protein
MNTLMNRIAVAVAMIGVLASIAPANAQVEDLLKHGQSSGGASASGLGKLGGMGGALSGGSLSSGTTGNVAGLLEFCMKNNFLGGTDSSSVKDQLMGKLGGEPAPDSGYAEGAQGVLKSGDGKQVDLSGGGLKAQATKQVCDRVLAQAKSML